MSRSYLVQTEDIEMRSQQRNDNYLTPGPITTPTVTNNPAKFFVENPLSISPIPSNVIPISAVRLAPSSLIIRALTNARKDTSAESVLPTNESVEADDRPSLRRAAWMIPQLYIVPTNQNARTLPPKITAQP